MTNFNLVNKIYKALLDNDYLDGPYFNEEGIKKIIEKCLAK